MNSLNRFLNRWKILFIPDPAEFMEFATIYAQEYTSFRVENVEHRTTLIGNLSNLFKICKWLATPRSFDHDILAIVTDKYSPMYQIPKKKNKFRRTKARAVDQHL